MRTVTLARQAMATRFELVLHGENETALRAAGEEALDEIDRLEDELSYFLTTSQIFRVNQAAAKEPVRVTSEVFHLLQRARSLTEETDGVFDITVASLMRCWGFYERAGQVPEPAALGQARACVGMGLVELNAADSTVQFTRKGVQLDLGSLGKGFAIERAGVLLREAGVISALMHGGTSTVLAIGSPPNAEHWKIAIEHPTSELGARPNTKLETSKNLSPLATVSLRDQSLSVSAVWGKSFTAAEKRYGHVIDPRTGEPSAGALLAAVVVPSATESDALSTMLLTVGPDGFAQVLNLREGMRALVAATAPDGKALRIESRGFDFPPQ